MLFYGCSWIEQSGVSSSGSISAVPSEPAVVKIFQAVRNSDSSFAARGEGNDS